MPVKMTEVSFRRSHRCPGGARALAHVFALDRHCEAPKIDEAREHVA